MNEIEEKLEKALRKALSEIDGLENYSLLASIGKAKGDTEFKIIVSAEVSNITDSNNAKVEKESCNDSPSAPETSEGVLPTVPDGIGQYLVAVKSSSKEMLDGYVAYDCALLDRNTQKIISGALKLFIEAEKGLLALSAINKAAKKAKNCFLPCVCKIEGKNVYLEELINA